MRPPRDPDSRKFESRTERAPRFLTPPQADHLKNVSGRG